MAIAYKASGTLAETETSGAALSPTCPATVDVNDILLAHVFHLNITTTPATPSGWTLLYGPADLGTGTAVGRAWVFGKLAVGNEDGTSIAFGTTGGTSGRAARIHSFSGWVSGSLTDVVPASQMSDIPSEGSIPLPTVTTTVNGALAVAFLVQDDNNTFAAASGESGGSWTEPIAEDVDTAIGAQGYVFGIQVCTPTANPGSVTGGTANATADEGSSIGVEIRPNLPAVTGSIATTQGGDTGDLNGTATPPAISGTVATTQAADTADFNGTVTAPTFTGTIATTQAGDVADLDGSTTPPTFTAVLTGIQGADTGDLEGSATPPDITGTIGADQADDTADLAGTHTLPTFTAALEADQDPDTANLSGTSGDNVIGVLAVTQADDTAEFTGTFSAGITGNLAGIQANDTADLIGAVAAPIFWMPAPVAYTPGNGHEPAGRGYTPAPRAYVPLGG